MTQNEKFSMQMAYCDDFLFNEIFILDHLMQKLKMSIFVVLLNKIKI